MNTPKPFNDLSWNDDPLHSPNRTEYIEKLRARVKELESICNEVSKEYPLQKYLEERLGTKGEHSHFETIDNTASKLTALEKEVSDLRSALKLCITALNTAGHFSAINSETQKPYEFSESIAYATAIEFSKPLIIKSTPHGATERQKE